MRRFIPVVILSLLTLSGCNEPQSPDWKSEFGERLHEFGHRNWIVVADSAYPKQSAAGIETIHTHEGQIEVLRFVLEKIDQAEHIQAVTMLDEELDLVTESASPGVEEYRAQLKQLLGSRPVNAMPHDEIIAQLDRASERFNVLLLKTDLTIPYTSVFLELDCGYWDKKREADLRELSGKSMRK
ncbi:RbsD/FucU domain-containing protein [Pelagicoccus sp. SDUM812005]|uniref:RbsD/FucU domain-containing protein n=1 Tax=Pelagicoccus sp. SDUM812005 TaxID=3041257 RepID=UPI0028107F7B|nr:RbsD/FucU domain-containing protein [Pelagicoccus sp. SDUM812005]MDQ8180328.1 RbsD/FucU domain-containing protein [Pelagicoccus sp. SDUM812005]